MTALWIVLGYGAWCLLACLVLPMIDDDERRLFEWARSGPPFAYTLILTFWPLVVWMMWKNGWHGPEMSDAEKAQWEAQWGSWRTRKKR